MSDASAPERSSGAGVPGRVHLVGAGPGDRGLITVRALELIAQADVIVYDRLIPAGALDGARPDAELVFVGKQGGGPSVRQEDIDAFLIEHARAGRTVVRLKGGDPLVFGRGGEEALALREAGIPFEIVPGVSAGVAAPAYAGIPVTHRGLSTAVALITGHTRADGPREASGTPHRRAGGDSDGVTPAQGARSGRLAAETDLDWQALAAFPGTLVFYMGVARLPEIATQLVAAGRSPAEPAAVIERGTLPGQRLLAGTLSELPRLAEDAGMRAPAVIVVGQVVELAESLRWRVPQPLAGVSIAVTRARAQGSALAARLEELGASVVQAPVIRISPLPGGPLDPSPYDLLCLTSPNGVGLLFQRLSAGGRDSRALAGITVAAIGPGTAGALAEHGIAADVVPERFLAEGLVEALRDVPVKRALVARAAEARDVLPDALRSRGAEVDVLALYETLAEPLSEPARAALAAADYITFTSSSTVRFFLQTAALPDGIRIASIGPVTSAALREHGVEVHVEAERHDIDGLLQALVDDTSRRTGTAGAARRAGGGAEGRAGGGAEGRAGGGAEGRAGGGAGAAEPGLGEGDSAEG